MGCDGGGAFPLAPAAGGEGRCPTAHQFVPQVSFTWGNLRCRYGGMFLCQQIETCVLEPCSWGTFPTDGGEAAQTLPGGESAPHGVRPHRPPAQHRLRCAGPALRPEVVEEHPRTTRGLAADGGGGGRRKKGQRAAHEPARGFCRGREGCLFLLLSDSSKAEADHM